MQKKMASLGGVPVLQVVRMKRGGNEAMPAQMEAMRKQGGHSSAPAGRGGGALFEVTTESSGFSTTAIPDSVFAIPAGYQQK